MTVCSFLQEKSVLGGFVLSDLFQPPDFVVSITFDCIPCIVTSFLACPSIVSKCGLNNQMPMFVRLCNYLNHYQLYNSLRSQTRAAYGFVAVFR